MPPNARACRWSRCCCGLQLNLVSLGVPKPTHLRSSDSRVRNFHWPRRGWERFQVVVTSSGWPARLARSLFGVPALDVRTYEVPVLHSAAPPLRLAFAADFHAGPT